MANAPISATGTPETGAVLGGKYRVVRQLGEGGMGLVLEAEQIVTGKRVAIKWMRPELAARPEAVERFLREARASARVRHPNVVDVYDAVHDGSAVFLVMELLEGEPLSAMLERGGMPAHELIALLLDAMRGVAAAHKQGVIHRDIKPDNIFLAQETDRRLRTPKVLDFGISKLSGGSEALSLTQTGATLGTPLYMSYEQLCGARDIDARTDVYAFGVILYEALTGRPPYEADTFPELIVKIANTKPVTPKALRSDIPRSLDRLIQAAMAKERDQRFASLDVMIAELQPFATAELFRIQMTADDSALPRVVSPSQQPMAAEPPMLLLERTEGGPADTPMNATVSAPEIPRRRDIMPWVIGAALVAVALWAMTWFSGSKAPSAAGPNDLVRPAAASPAAASPAAAASNPTPPLTDLERGVAPPTPPSAAPPSSAAEVGQAPDARKPNNPVRPRPELRVAKPEPALPVRPASLGSLPAAPPAASQTKPPAASPANLRAGRPRSQDF